MKGELREMKSNMENRPVIVLVEHNSIVKARIRDILQDQEVKIHEAFDRTELMEILKFYHYNVDLIISEIDIDPENLFSGIELIRFVKKKKSSIPVLILSSNGKKEIITRCLMEGAADYVLKPFNDEYLKEKILKYINLESLTESTVIKLNLRNYIESEIYKARKGKYPFSLLLVVFDSQNEEGEESPRYEFYRYAEALYKELKSLLWDSDLYVQHGFQSHLGFFPFCDASNTETLIEKFKARFESFKHIEPYMMYYKISCSVTTYPDDGTTASELLRVLGQRSKGKELPDLSQEE